MKYSCAITGRHMKQPANCLSARQGPGKMRLIRNSKLKSPASEIKINHIFDCFECKT